MALDMLPDLAATKIVERLAGNGVFQLLALASLSRQWRSVVREHKLSELRLESKVSLSQQRHPFQGDMLAVKFLQSTTEQKTRFFISAARLLRQHNAVFCSGEAITDIVLLEVAKGNADTFCIEDSSQVTDASLTILIASHRYIKHLRLKNLSRVCGAFVSTLIREAKHLETLELCNMPSMKWLHMIRSPMDVLPMLRYLALSEVGADGVEQALFHHLPFLQRASLEGSPSLVWAAARSCPFLSEVVLTSTCSSRTDRCLAGLLTAPSLRVLEIQPKSFMLNCDHMYLIGMMNLCELRLDSHSFKQQPLNRAGLSHIDNEGVKALVDSICARTLTQKGRQAFKLSLCGASAISQDAVSALLRLPLLSGLMLDGCHRISSIDKMRLIAKVKAGRELLASGSRRRVVSHTSIQIEVSCQV